MLNDPFNNISVTSRSSVWIWGGGGGGRKYRNKTNTIPSITNKLFRYRDIEIPHVMASRVVVQLPTNGVRALITYPVFTQHHFHIEMLMLFLMLFHR